MNCAGANLVPCRGSVQASDQYILLAMTDAINASNVISEVKRTPLAAMTDLLISTKSALRRPITYITAVKRHCTDGVTKCPKTLQIMPLGMISS